MATNCLTLVGNSQTGSFYGDGQTGRWRTVRNLKVTGYGTPPTVATSGTLAAVTIGGVSLGTGRVIAVEFAAGNDFGQKDLGNRQYTALVELFEDGNASSGLPANAITNLKYLDSFSEDLNINIDDDGNYKYSHTVKIKYMSAGGGFDPIVMSKTVAENIFNGTNYESLTNILGKNISYGRAGRKLYSESYNLKTNECSFTKNYNLLATNSGTDYSITVTNKLSINERGLSEVSESGSIIGLSGYTTLAAALVTEIAASYTRCNNLFNVFKGYVHGSNNALYSQPVTVQKNVDLNGDTAKYTVTYINNVSLDIANQVFSEEISMLSKQGDFYNIVYDGKFKSFNKKSSSFNGTTLLATKFSNIASAAPSGYKLMNKNASVNKYGKEVAYSATYTTDPSFFITGNWRKMEVSVQDKPAQVFHQEYNIPKKKVVVSQGFNVDISSRIVNVKLLIPRTLGQNVFTTIPTLSTYLNSVKPFLINKCLAVYNDFSLNSRNPVLDMAFLTNNNYRFGSNRNLDISLEIKYVVKKTSLTDSII